MGGITSVRTEGVQIEPRDESHDNRSRPQRRGTLFTQFLGSLPSITGILTIVEQPLHPVTGALHHRGGFTETSRLYRGQWAHLHAVGRSGDGHVDNTTGGLGLMNLVMGLRPRVLPRHDDTSWRHKPGRPDTSLHASVTPGRRRRSPRPAGSSTLSRLRPSAPPRTRARTGRPGARRPSARPRVVPTASSSSSTPPSSPSRRSRAARTTWSRLRSSCSAIRSSAAPRSTQLLVALAAQRRQRAELRRALAVVARHQRDQRDLARREAGQPGAEDQVATSACGGRRSRPPCRRRAAAPPPPPAPARPGSGSPAPGSASSSWCASDAMCSACTRSTPCWRARLRTLASRTSGTSGGSAGASRPARKIPSRRPASVTSMPGAPLASSTACSTTAAGEDHLAAPALDPRHAVAVARRARGQLVDQRVERLARQHEALHAVERQLGRAARRRREVAHAAAEPDEPLAARRRHPRRVLQRPQRPRAQLRDRARLRGPVARQEALRRAHRAQRPRGDRARAPLAHLHQLQAAAAEVEHDAVRQRGRVGRRHVASSSASSSPRQHADRQPRLALRPLDERRPVRRVADRARRDRLDVVALRSRSSRRRRRTRAASPARAPCAASDSAAVVGSSSPPIRTMSLSSSVRFHQPPSPVVKTTSRKLLEPRSMTAARGAHASASCARARCARISSACTSRGCPPDGSAAVGPAAVGGQLPRVLRVGEAALERVEQLCARVGVVHRHDELHARVEVARHQVRGADEDGRLLAALERVDARVLEEAADDRHDADVLGDAGHTRPQAARAAHVQLDRHARLRGAVERADAGGVDERVHLHADARVLARLVRVDRRVDLADDPLAQVQRRDEHAAVVLGPRVAGQLVEQLGDLAGEPLRRR